MNKSKIVFVTILVFVLTFHLTSAVFLNSVEVDTLSPGQEGSIKIELENNLGDDATDVSLSLDFSGISLTPIGSSQQAVEEIQDNDDETFVFRVRASSETTPDSYEIPYTLEYTVNDKFSTRKGTIGIDVKANPILSLSANIDKPILETKTQLSIKIVNKGFFGARFVSIKIIPEGFITLSEDKEYLGEVNSDDFETANFDVIFKKTAPSVEVITEYIDFDNNKKIEITTIPLKVYTQDKAVELGLVTPSKTLSYALAIAGVVFLFFLWRSWKKRARRKKNQRLQNKSVANF